jgi:glycerol uptake facilitator protein
MKLKDFTGAVLATFILIVLGDGVVANLVLGTKPADWNTIAMGWGFAVAMAGFIGSGANNPAIIITYAIRNREPVIKTAVVIFGTFVGGFLGAGGVFLMYRDGLVAAGMPNIWTSGAGAVFQNGENIGSYSMLTAGITEFIATMILMWSVMAVNDKRNSKLSSWGAFIVGSCVMVIGLCLGGPSGYSMNPARDLAPRIFGALAGTANLFEGWYWLVPPVLIPILACMVAAPLYDLFLNSEKGLHIKDSLAKAA